MHLDLFKPSYKIDNIVKKIHSKNKWMEVIYIVSQNNLLNYVGLRLKSDVHDHNGILLVTKDTVFTTEHANKLFVRTIHLNLNNFHFEKPNVTVVNKNEAKKALPKENDELRNLVDYLTIQTEIIYQKINLENKVPLLKVLTTLFPSVQKISNYDNIFTLFNALEAKENYTYRHYIAVGVIANVVGKWINLSEQELILLTFAGILHDIGKMSIPKEILNKEGPLTNEEFELIKKHTIYGYDMIKNTDGLHHRIALVALQHHERMDGSGYPFGITADKIDLFSRIIGIADVLHAMTSQRVYRNATPFFKVIKEMHEGVFGKFDPKIILILMKQIMNALVGKQVLLTDERIGKVVMINPYNSITPMILVDNNVIIDLNANKNIEIESIL